MRRAMPPGSPDFISTAGKIQVITALENMLKFNDDQEYIDHCKYCIDIVRQGVEFNYYEVLDFIGVTSEPVPAEVSIEVIFIMKMFDHISLSLSKLPRAAADYVELECYTKFCGFENSAAVYLSYYIFLVRTQQYRVPIFKEALPITLIHYRDMLLRYERYKRYPRLTEEMMMDICVRREQQMKLIL